jgi:sugar phosphate isomerase/epimerase
LASDNCFAVKRWIRPSQWFPLIKEIGALSIEASTDNEMDPLFSTDAYMNDWVKDVQEQEQKHSMKVRSFFTGYQTYRTAGLAHPDPRVRQRIKEGWFMPLIGHAKTLGADIGFSFHAVQAEFLEDPKNYEDVVSVYIDEYAELARIAAKSGVKLCAEQMYTPHQPPWTVKDSFAFLKAVYARGGSPFYLAIDTGHMVGQRKFTFPDRKRILEALAILRRKERLRGLWFGPLLAYEKLKAQSQKPASDDERFAEELKEFLKSYDYMFAPAEDSDPYKWLKTLGAWSPIIHMQQTDGFSSSHAPFTPETNSRGIINGKQLLESLAESFSSEEKGMPPKTGKIVLAFEIFIPNVQYSYDGIEDLKETFAYWKRFIPKDGITLQEALSNLS